MREDRFVTDAIRERARRSAGETERARRDNTQDITLERARAPEYVHRLPPGTGTTLYGAALTRRVRLFRAIRRMMGGRK